MKPITNKNDKVYTPEHVVNEVLDIFLPMVRKDETILEPFRGTGNFYTKFPKKQRAWCEIDNGRDFLMCQKKYDWIITNPPYSSFGVMLSKMLSIADKLVLVIPVNKLLSSLPKLIDIIRYGSNIKKIHYLGSGRQIGFPFGFPVAAVYIERDYIGPIIMSYADRCGIRNVKKSISLFKLK